MVSVLAHRRRGNAVVEQLGLGRRDRSWANGTPADSDDKRACRLVVRGDIGKQATRASFEKANAHCIVLVTSMSTLYIILHDLPVASLLGVGAYLYSRKRHAVARV